MAFNIINTLFNDLLTSAIASKNIACVKLISGVEYMGKVKYLDSGYYEISEVIEVTYNPYTRQIELKPACNANVNAKLYFKVGDVIGLPPISITLDSEYRSALTSITRRSK